MPHLASKQQELNHVCLPDKHVFTSLYHLSKHVLDIILAEKQSARLKYIMS